MNINGGEWADSGNLNIGDPNPSQYSEAGASAGTGTIIVNPGSALYGKLTLNPGGTLQILGGYVGTNGLNLANGGTLVFNSGYLTVGGGVLTLPAGGYAFGGSGTPSVQLLGNTSMSSNSGSLQIGEAGLPANLTCYSPNNTAGEIDLGVNISQSGSNTNPNASAGTLTLYSSGLTTSYLQAGLNGGAGTIVLQATSTLSVTGANGLLIGSGGYTGPNGFVPSNGTLAITQSGTVRAPSVNDGFNGGAGTITMDTGTLAVANALYVGRGTAAGSSQSTIGFCFAGYYRRSAHRHIAIGRLRQRRHAGRHGNHCPERNRDVDELWNLDHR